jgi:Metallo-peptidase family M12B Reprolysin-like
MTMFDPLRKAVGTALLLLALPAAQAAPAVLVPWQDVTGSAPAAQAAQAARKSPTARPLQARVFTLDKAPLEALARKLPDEQADPASRLAVNLPMPDGSALTFQLFATEVMAPGLAARYPQIRSFAGVADSNPHITGRFDLGPRGLRGQVFTPQGEVYIDPQGQGDLRRHHSYYTRDLAPRARLRDTVLRNRSSRAQAAGQGAPSIQIGPMHVQRAGLRTYRLAIATTGEYAAFQDPDHAPPDKAIVLAELVALTNRVTGIYEREAGIRLQLTANTDALIFTDPATDPYDDQDGLQILEANTEVFNGTVGEGSYDIGHTVSTGGGGVAGLGVVCGAEKAIGVTGLPEPVGDAFYVDYVAHEMGHQFGADHTFNGVEGSCGGGNRYGPMAYEPGSGVTIMGYAGICGADDVAPHSIPNFHVASLRQIFSYTREGAGATCGRASRFGWRQVLAFAGPGGFTIPARTPFELTGWTGPARDPMLAYQWEQVDLGAEGPPDQPDATAPLFRSFPPTVSPTRVFPQASDLINGTHTLGEILPAVSREMNFRFNVRDNTLGPRHGGFASADLRVRVTAAAGPFKVLAPNTAGQFRGGSLLTVQWDVANTRQPPVSCAAVDILLSLDGGKTFPTLLKPWAANTGRDTVTLPRVATTQARVKVKCHGNVFFDISDADFIIR